MLSINNKNHIEKMRKYHRTKDMINLLMYFPEISPIIDLTIIESVQDYLANYDYCKKFYAHRIDSLITKPVIYDIETSGDNQDFVKLIERIKEIDSEGVLILFDVTYEYSERYERYAGISVGVSIDKGVYIDAVGKGFDGREVSKGKITHEGYFMPWSQLKNLRIENFKSFQNYRIDEDKYKISRNERIEFLLSTGADKINVEKAIPIKYKPIPDFIWEDVIKNIIRKLPKVAEELSQVGLSEFAISGHTEGENFLPWGMFDSSRGVRK